MSKDTAYIDPGGQELKEIPPYICVDKKTAEVYALQFKNICITHRHDFGIVDMWQVRTPADPKSKPLYTLLRRYTAWDDKCYIYQHPDLKG